MIIVIVITIILFFSFNINLYSFHFDTEIIIAMIGYTLTNFIKEFILLKIIYFFSAQSVSILTISKTIGNTISYIILVIKNVKDKDEDDILFFTFEILGILIILFAILIYDEIIIIHKWNLERNVKVVIIKRMEIEMKNNSLGSVNLIENPIITTVEDS